MSEGAASVAAAGGRSPYVGLSFYTEADAEWFFGRDREAQTIIANLRAARLTILYAPSGVGKSSLLRAGVAHHINELARRRRAARGAPGFLPVVFAAYRDDPVDGLMDAIAAALARVGTDADVELARGGLAAAIEAAATATGTRLLIILDQFEEYLLYAAGERADRRLADELASCVNRPELRVNFLIAIREDAYAGLGDLFAGRVTNVYGNHLALEYLDRDAARSAIVQPLDHFNATHPDRDPIEVQPELVDAVLDEVRTGEVLGADAPGGSAHGPAASPASGGAEGAAPPPAAHERMETPYLQLVMSTLWAREREQGSRTLRLQTLRELGGALEIVRSHLDGALAALSTSERATAVDVFGYLVTPSGAKIAYAVSDLAELVGRPRGEVAQLLARLAQGAARILRHVPAPAASSHPDDRYEIFHDVLAAPIRDWRARETAARVERRRSEAEAEARRERGRARTFRALAIGSIALLAVAVALVAFAVGERHDAVAQQAVARSLLLAADAESNLGLNPTLSTLLALRALDERDTTQAQQALRDALSSVQMLLVLDADPDGVDGAAFSADGSEVATADWHGNTRIYSAHTGALLATLAEPGGTAVNSAQFSPSGVQVVTAAADGSVRVWDAQTRTLQLTLRAHGAASGAAVNSARFSPGGAQIVTAGVDGTAHVYDARTGALMSTMREPGGRALATAAFSPNGAEIVTAGADDGTARIWNTRTGALLLTVRQPGGVFDAAFSPDGAQIVTAGADGSARIWSARGGALLTALAEPGRAFVASAQFSPDGSRIVTAADDGTARIWNARTGVLLSTFAEPTGAELDDASFSANGAQIVTASTDGTARIWDADTAQLQVVQEPHLAALAGAALSPDGATLLTVSGVDGTARIFDADTGVLLRTLANPGGGLRLPPGGGLVASAAFTSAAFSPDGTRIVTAGADGIVQTWDAQTGARLSLVPDLSLLQSLSPVDAPAVIRSVQFGPDGSQIVTAASDGMATIHDASTGPVRLREPGDAGLTDATFSPDGSQIVTASDDGTARIWSARTGKLMKTLTEPAGARGAISSAVFSPDGTQILAAAEDQGTAWIWNARTGALLSTFQEPDGNRFVHAAFSPDGSEVVTTSFGGSAYAEEGTTLYADTDSGAARIWDARTGALLTTYPEPGGSGVVSAAFNRDGSQIVTASLDGTARIWSTRLAGPISSLRPLARRLVQRPLTAQERKTYLTGIGG